MDETEALRQSVEVLKREVERLETDLRAKKAMINSLCDAAKLPRAYEDVGSEAASAAAGASIGSPGVRRDLYYGKPLSTCIREFLNYRRSRDLGPATVKEIYEALKTGGYKFDTKNDLNAMRGLRVSLTKNTSIFHKLPGGEFGLIEWYPKIRKGHDE